MVLYKMVNEPGQISKTLDMYSFLMVCLRC